MIKYFYEDTGMYIDWEQLSKLPEIDTLIDIGVSDHGTKDLYNRFPNADLILIDPLEESEKFFNEKLRHRNAIFFKTALGRKIDQKYLNIEKRIGRSTFLNVTDINSEGPFSGKRLVQLNKLDNLIKQKDLGKTGIKIDTEGYELEVILGGKETIKKCEFLIAEVRHNHESFEGVYKMHEFLEVMHSYDFQLSMILTAKPFIADLCFEPIERLMGKDLKY